MGVEDVGVGEERQHLGLTSDVIKIGAGAVEVDGLDRHNRRAHWHAQGLVHNGADAGPDLTDDLVGARVERELQLSRLFSVFMGHDDGDFSFDARLETRLELVIDEALNPINRVRDLGKGLELLLVVQMRRFFDKR